MPYQASHTPPTADWAEHAGPCNRWMRLWAPMLMACLICSACQRAERLGTSEQRLYCRAQAMGNKFSGGNVEAMFQACLRQLIQPGSNARPNTLPPAITSEADRTKAYTHCVFHQQDIQAAYNLQNGLGGRIPHFEREFGRDHPRTIAAREEYDRAVQSLETLIPERLREGQALIPDAAEKFSRCDRREFGLQ